MAKLPDFIIIGSMKSGTTALWHNLNQHPDITMGKNPEDPKKASTEIRFFDNGGPHHTWKKGVDWYKRLFSGKCSGEKCADYVGKKWAMERIAKHCPNTKLILCVREPVSRMYSEVQMSEYRRMGNKHNFASIIQSNKGYVDRSKYFKRIKQHVLPFFPKEQLHVAVAEWMKNDTANEINRIYKFLGLKPFETQVLHQHSKDRDKRITQYKVWETEYPNMKTELHRKLQEDFKGQNEKLFNFIGFEIPEWQ